MAKERRRNMELSGESQTKFSSWSALPNDLLLAILSRLDEKELFWAVSSVCRSWQLACWDVLFWKGELLDLSKLMISRYSNFVENNYQKMGLALEKVVKSLFGSHGDTLADVSRNCHALVLPVIHLDEHLVYVAERIPKVRSIGLKMDHITGKGFSRAIRNWAELEFMLMGSINDQHYTHIIQEIGINCGKLQILYIYCRTCPNEHFRLDEYNSGVLANNLHSLKMLVLVDCIICKFGLHTILSNCRQLVDVNLKSCMRALEEGKVTRRRRALDPKPFTFIPGKLSIIISQCVGSDEWRVDTLPGERNIMTIINHLWMETGDASGRPKE